MSRHGLIGAYIAIAMWPTSAGAFDLQGHRGARGLVAENTLEAFATALRLGVTTIETDLALTKDGVLVISHDPRLNPDIVRDDTGAWLIQPTAPIHALTLAELKPFDIGRIDPATRYGKQFSNQKAVDGARFPTLSEVFDLGARAPRPPRYNIETKLTPLHPQDAPPPDEFARSVVAAVRKAGQSTRVTIQSFDWRTLRIVKEIAPDIATSCLTIASKDMDTVAPESGKPSPWLAGLDPAAFAGSLPRTVKAAGCAVWSPFWRNVDAAAVADAHALGLRVIPWTVNDPADMAKLVDSGVDGLITDYLDRALKLLADRGIAVDN